jgi:hypothetical protein
MNYLPRIADIILQKKLQSKGAVLIEGPKWCGKTSTAMQASKIDTDKMSAPSFMMVLTAVGNYAYCRKDGVWIVPLGCLKY